MSKPEGIRRLLRFSLRTLLLLVALATGPLVAWRVYVEPFRQQAATMALIEQLGGSYQTQTGGRAWLRRMLGDERFQDVTHVNLADCDEPDKFIGAVCRLPRLQTLAVGGPAVDDAHLARLHNMTALHGLLLDTTSVSDEALVALAGKLPDLKVYRSQRRAVSSIQVKNNSVVTRQRPAPACFQEGVSSEFFNEATEVVPFFGASEASNLADSDLIYLQQMRSLEKLSLNRAAISSEGVKMLEGLIGLKELDLTWTGVHDLSPLSRMTKLERLSLHCCVIRDDDLRHIAHLTELRELQLGFAEVTDEGLKHLAGLVNLEELGLSEDRITDEGLPSLYNLKKLKRLALAGSIGKSFLPGDAYVTTRGSSDLQRKIGNSLEIYGRPKDGDLAGLRRRIAGAGGNVGLELSPWDSLHLHEINGRSNLKRLNAAGSLVDDRGLAILGQLRAIEELDLRDTWITDAGLAQIAALGNLRRLDLSNTRVTDAGLKHLAGLQGLQELRINETGITGVGLAELKACTKLHTIVAEFNFATNFWRSLDRHEGLTDEGLQSMGQLTSLRHVEITHSKVTDNGLAQLGSLPHLESLRLESTKVRGDAFRYLSSLGNLQAVRLGLNALDDDGVAALAQLPGLTKLVIFSEHISPAAVGRLKFALPRCSIDVAIE